MSLCCHGSEEIVSMVILCVLSKHIQAQMIRKDLVDYGRIWQAKAIVLIIEIRLIEIRLVFVVRS
jgi:hypothetical protein